MHSRSLTVLDLSKNPITEKSFDSLVNLLTKNQILKTVYLNDIAVKSKVMWSKVNRFGDRV